MSKAPAMASQRAGTVLAAAFLRNAFSFENAISMGLHRPHDLELITAQMTGVTFAIAVAVVPENIRRISRAQLQKMRRKTMPQRMDADLLGDACRRIG